MWPKPEAPRRRLFLAVWPDAQQRRRLAGHRDDWRWPAGARPVGDADLHATLHFIGGFEPERLPALCDRLAAIAPRPILLQPAGMAVWRGGLAVLALRGDSALAALHQDLANVLVAFDVRLDVRPYAPHVTLARHAGGALPPGTVPAWDWHAAGFALAASGARAEVRYEVLAAWGPPGAPTDH